MRFNKGDLSRSVKEKLTRRGATRKVPLQVRELHSKRENPTSSRSIPSQTKSPIKQNPSDKKPHQTKNAYLGRADGLLPRQAPDPLVGGRVSNRAN